MTFDLEKHERERLSTMRTAAQGRILRYRKEIQDAENLIENLRRLELGAIQEARVIDKALEASNPYRKAKA